MRKQHGPSSLLLPRSACRTFIGYANLIYICQAIIDQMTRDDTVRCLLSKIDEVYTFLVKAELRDIKSMKTVIERICQQTLECSYFIREYSQNKKFRELT